jgi:LTXXQ motif family protein
LKSSIAIAALVVASIGLAVPVIAQTAPASSDGSQIGLSLDASSTAPADDSAAPPAPGPDGGRHMGGMHHMMPGGQMGPAALLALACSPQGTETLDVALLRLSYRLDLTADQKPLYDAFRDKALTTQTNFADTCKADRPTATADAKPDFLTRLKDRLTVEQARLTALNDVLPSFETLYASLSDTQKAALLPHPGMGMGNHPMWDRMNRPDAPGRG